MNQSIEKALIVGDETIDLQDCYVLRDHLAHKAQVVIKSAVSNTDQSHLLLVDIKVPGSKKMTLTLGVPFQQAMKMMRAVITWNESHTYDSDLNTDMILTLINTHAPELKSSPWTDDAIQAVRDIITENNAEAAIKSDLLKMAELSLEEKNNE